MKYKNLLVIFCVFVLCGCATPQRVSPLSLPDQRQVFTNGAAVAVSEKSVTVMVKSAVEDIMSSERPTFIVKIYNPTSESIDFASSDINTFLNGESHKLFTYEELQSEARRNANIQKALLVLNAIGGAASASQAGYVAQQGTADVQLYDGYGNTSRGTAYYTSYGYDSAVAQREWDDVSDQLDRDKQSLQQFTNTAKLTLDNTLRRETIAPQSSYVGLITLDSVPVSESNEISIGINVANESHVFKFSVE